MEFLDGMKLLDTAEHVRNFKERTVAFWGGIMALNHSVDLKTSTHIKRGGAAMLDAHLDQPQLPLDSGWDDQGNYFSNVEGR